MPLFSGTPTFDNGQAGRVAITNEGHIEVAIHEPLLPFGSMHAEKLTHQIQFDGVYGLDPQLTRTTTANSGTVTSADGQFVLQTSTDAAGYAVLQSRHRIRYRPGQGLVGKCTAVFGTGVADSYQLVGFGHAESGLYFGYVGTAFGILYVTGGVRECRTLTVTVGSSHAENVTVTLNGVAHTIAVTNSGSTKKTAYELSKGSYPGWQAMQVGATVVFLADSAGAKSGAYTLTGGTSATGTFAQTVAGVTSTDTFIPKTTWNVDKMDGTGKSGITLDPTKGNVYRFDIQYLGYGVLVFRVEIVPTNGNSPTFIPVHIIRYPNSYTVPSFSNPTFPFAAIAYNDGSVTNTTLKVACANAAVEGDQFLTGSHFAYRASSGSVSTSLVPLFTVRNDYMKAGKTNQTVVRLQSLTGALKHNFSGEIYVIRDATLTGTPDFVSHSTYSSTSVDYSATGVSYADNRQLILTESLGDTGNFEHIFQNTTMQPGETITLAAKVFSGTANNVIVGLNTREDS